MRNKTIKRMILMMGRLRREGKRPNRIKRGRKNKSKRSLRRSNRANKFKMKWPMK